MIQTIVPAAILANHLIDEKENKDPYFKPKGDVEAGPIFSSQNIVRQERKVEAWKHFVFSIAYIVTGIGRDVGLWWGDGKGMYCYLRLEEGY